MYKSEIEIKSTNFIKNLTFELEATSLSDADKKIKEFLSAHNIEWNLISTEEV